MEVVTVEPVDVTMVVEKPVPDTWNTVPVGLLLADHCNEMESVLEALMIKDAALVDMVVVLNSAADEVE
jgi:hypothetical protein